jgi:kynureninase
VSLRHRHGFAIVRALIDRGVIGDFRPPDLCRFGFAPLYTRYVDLWEAAGRILEVMDEEAYLRPAYAERTYIT